MSVSVQCPIISQFKCPFYPILFRFVFKPKFIFSQPFWSDHCANMEINKSPPNLPQCLSLENWKFKYRLPVWSELRHDKTNKMSGRPAKTQISLGIHPVWSGSCLCAQWVAEGPRFLQADSEDFDQTGQMPRLIWVIVGRTLTLLVLSCHGSSVCFVQSFPLI